MANQEASLERTRGRERRNAVGPGSPREIHGRRKQGEALRARLRSPDPLHQHDQPHPADPRQTEHGGPLHLIRRDNVTLQIECAVAARLVAPGQMIGIAHECDRRDSFRLTKERRMALVEGGAPPVLRQRLTRFPRFDAGYRAVRNKVIGLPTLRSVLPSTAGSDFPKTMEAIAPAVY